MTITETPINYEDIQLKYNKLNYPIPCDKHLPKNYFVSLFIGSRGSGKSYCIVNLLKHYEQCGIYDPITKEKVAQRIILFSPTYLANPVFKSLKYLSEDDIVNNYSDEALLEKVDDVENEKDNTERYKTLMKVYKKFLNVKHIDELSHDELIELSLLEFEQPEEPKYPHGCVVFMIFDDLIGSDAFKQTGKSALTNLVLKNRHMRINILCATQNLRAIPKSIRTNTSLFVIFKFASKKIILEDLHTEISNTLTIEKFEELYEYATEDEHDCLVIDFTNPKQERFKKNFKSVLNIS